MTAITIIRINVLLHVDFTDLSYSMHDAAFWSVAEPAIAIANCCVATLRPLLSIISPAYLWNSAKGSSANRVGYSGNGYSGNGYTANVSRGRPGINSKLENDEYPLTGVEAVTTITVTGGSDSGRRDSSSIASATHVSKA